MNAILRRAGSTNPVETLRGGGKYRSSMGFGSNQCKQLFVLLVAVGGGAGSGKSTLATLRAERIFAQIIWSGMTNLAGNVQDGCWLGDGWVGGCHKRAADELLPQI